MSADNKKAPAFPGQEKNGDGSHHYSHPGLTKREYFAGLAMQAMVTGILACGNEVDDDAAARIVLIAPVLADGQIAALSKGGDA
jgi:hypothetical protein